MDSLNRRATFPWFAFRVVVVHTLTYFVFGLIMSNLLDYGELFRREVIRDYMRPIDDHNLLAGPFLQPIRGLIFAIGLWPLRELLVARKRGWLVLWGLLVTIGILSTPAASPGSFEGMVYTRLPLWYHLIGYPEIVLQTLAFSILLVRWEQRHARRVEASVPRRTQLWTEIVRAVAAACFAWIGYAIGGILLALRANARAAATGAPKIDFEAAGKDVKIQLMFVVAFAVNAALVFWIARRWNARRIALPVVFLLFWFVDALVPWAYQTVVLGGSSIPSAILLGLFPAAIITLAIRTAPRALEQPLAAA
jgi:hypothetical protein